MKKTLLIISLFTVFILNNTYAEDNANSINSGNIFTEEEITNEISPEDSSEPGMGLIKDLVIKSEIKIGTPLVIDLTQSQKKLEENLGVPLEFEWSMKGATTKNGSNFSRTFEQTGEKLINLDVYKTEQGEKKLLFTKNIHIFAYSHKTPIIFEKAIQKQKIDQYIKRTLEEGVFIENIEPISIDQIENQDLIKLFDNFTQDQEYLGIWGSKDFIFSVISKLNREVNSSNQGDTIQKKYNLVLISPFNIDVSKNYIRNFLSNKDYINSILLLPEGSASQIRYNSDNIQDLENNLSSNEYTYVKVNTKSRISDIFFISNFVNTLSNNGFSTKSIYLILIIPFLFLGISIYKHLIGLSPIGSVIPISLTLLLFQIELIPATILIIMMILINLLLSKITNRYTLLYAPKIAFIITINIILILPLITTMINYNLLTVNTNDIIFIILFIIISERLITVILSKELSEYRFNLLNTLLFAFISYAFFSIPLVNTLILTYPEFIIALVPMNFIIGRFTGLRITEYFRFREVIKSIEE